MPLPVTRLRRWFAAAAILMIAIVAGMYFYARWRVSKVVHQVPAKLGLNIQQTAEGFAISKSEQGRTQFTVSASKAVQFKQGGRAELHNVKIVVYGKDSSRFDRIAGDDFEYDPASGNVTAKGRVFIDLEANPEGLKSSDQTPPPATNKPIHVETEGLVFNKDTGDGSVSGKVVFQTPDAMGSAVGAQYVSKTGALTLRSQVEVKVSQPRQYRITADHGAIQKGPRTIVLNGARLTRFGQELKADEAKFYLRADNTVERILADGDVEGVFRGTSTARSKSDHAEMLLTGNRNQLTQAVLTGNVQLATEGAEPAQAYAGRATLHFGVGQVIETVHAEDGVRLEQQKQGTDATATTPSSASSSAAANQRTIEMTAPAMDFLLKNGKVLQSATTSGPPQIALTQGGSQKTIITADKFTASFTEKNRLSLLHGEPNSKIVSSQPGQADRVSTSPVLEVAFQPQGGISTVTQSRGLTYVSGTQRAFAERGTYTEADQTLVLTGSPRVVDGGMSTTAQIVRFNRVTGDVVADGNVKSTYSDLKPQPDGALLATSDPIHVVSRSMTAHRSSAVAVYSGNARLWQNSNVVEAPTIEFDRDHRSLVAKGSAAQPVKTVLVQTDSKGKATPVTVTSELLTYLDTDRKIFLTGGVTAKGADATMTSRLMTVFLAARGPCKDGNCPASAGATTQLDKIVAENDVAIIEAARRATGQRLVYTAADDKYVLTGGPPCIFDAEHGKITGDSLTFYRHDDRVLVEGKSTSPAVTRTQVAR